MAHSRFHLQSATRVIARCRSYTRAGALAAFLIGSQPGHALEIFLNDVVPGGSDPIALAGFRAAAELWSERLFDDITVRINVGFAKLDPDVIGSTQNESAAFSYADVRDALIADARGLSDSVATANLPAGPSLRFRTNQPSGAVFLDQDGSNNNRFLNVNRANLKALGLLLDDGSADAEILFSSDFSFDFDRSNGISAGALDFVGVAAHEIGHALGFASGVDVVDRATGAGDQAPLDLNPFAVLSVLDLYRYSAASLALGGPGTLDLATGGTPLFALDQSLLVESLTVPFATGVANGDGDQASHWKGDFETLLLNPAATSGKLLTFGPVDVVALDVIGYDRFRVPEPATISLVALAFAVLLWRKRAYRGQVRDYRRL